MNNHSNNFQDKNIALSFVMINIFLVGRSVAFNSPTLIFQQI